VQTAFSNKNTMKNNRIVCQIAQKEKKDFLQKRSFRQWGVIITLVYWDNGVWRSADMKTLQGECPYTSSPDLVLYVAFKKLLSCLITMGHVDKDVYISTDSPKIMSYAGKRSPIKNGYDFSAIAKEVDLIAKKFRSLTINYVDTMSLTKALLVSSVSEGF
jgi:hypothetical protein